MTDKLSKAHRSWNMSRIRSKHTRPEQGVRSLLHRAGFRFSINGPLNNSLPGKPDLVFPRFKVVVFVHGCFWHRHTGCKYAYTPKSRVEFWKAKFAKNVERDRTVAKELEQSSWRQFIIWECELKGNNQRIVEKFSEFLALDVGCNSEGKRG
jgi:DNA mismatch endonuclease, patch repair protein